MPLTKVKIKLKPEKNSHNTPGVPLDISSFIEDDPQEIRGRIKYKLFRGGYRSYSLEAYAGPNIVVAQNGSRPEHLPLHFHVKSPDIEGEIRILVHNFKEYDGKPVPRQLRDLFEIPDLRAYLATNTESVYRTGRLAEEVRRINSRN